MPTPKSGRRSCRWRISPRPRKRPLSKLQLDGSFLDAKEVEVPAGESSGVVFPLADAPAGKLTARLKYELDTPTKRDALEQDDIGYAALNDAKPGRVLVVSPGNVALEVALATQRAGQLANIEFKTPDVLTSDEYKRDADSGAYDLIIYDQCAPADDAAGEHAVHRSACRRGRRGAAATKPAADGQTKDAEVNEARRATRRACQEPLRRRSSIGIGRTRCWRASNWETSILRTASCSSRRRARPC